MQRRIWKFIKGASKGEPNFDGFGGAVLQGKPNPKPNPASLGDGVSCKPQFAGETVIVACIC